MSNKNNNNKLKTSIALAIAGVAFITFAGRSLKTTIETKETTYLEATKLIESNQVSKVEIWQDSLKLTLTDGSVVTSPNPRTDESKNLIFNAPIDIEYKSSINYLEILSSMLTIGLILLIARQLSGKSKAFNGGIDTSDKKSQITFDDIAGCEEAKEQLQDIVYAIKNPEVFNMYNVRPAKGIILYGPAGTGKTKLAKALSNESGASFIAVNGANFVDKYAGNGASRVRHLFEEAKKKQPCIIFIDELDAIGGSRDSVGSHDERLQTLNQLLSCMDGFDDGNNITVIAATNRIESLDSALIRPGRFDSKIYIPLPDVKAREEMFKVFSKNKTIADNLDYTLLSKMTSYFSGADIENVMNMAGIYAIKDGSGAIKFEHISKAINVQIAGEDKKNRTGIKESDKELTAFHEAGHAIVARLLAGYNVTKISIIPTTRGAGGYTLIDTEEEAYRSKKDLYNQIAISLGGRIAEEIIYGKDFVTTGASSDIKNATNIARGMIECYGMSDKFGMINLENFKGVESSIIDEANLIISDIYKSTYKFLEENTDLLHRLKEALIEKEILHEDEFTSLYYEIMSWREIKELEKELKKKKFIEETEEDTFF